MCKIADCVMFLLLALCAIGDWKKKEVSLLMLILMSVLAVVFACFCKDISLWMRLVGAGVGGICFLISKCTKESIGYGDSWLITILGVHLGGMRLLQLLLLASVVAGVIALFFLWRRRWKKHTTLPFIPFLSLAFLGVMFL